MNDATVGGAVHRAVSVVPSTVGWTQGLDTDLNRLVDELMPRRD
jgi:hypothetical protein